MKESKKEIVQVGASYPRHFHVRRLGDDEHERTLKHGEIIRFVRANIEVLFTQTIPAHLRHDPINIREVRRMIAPEVNAWVWRWQNDQDFRLTLQHVYHALRLMRIGKVVFRIEGEFVMLPVKPADNITTHIELRRMP